MDEKKRKNEMQPRRTPPIVFGAALFLDFDGVLVDFADKPHQVTLEPGLTGILDLLGHGLGGAIAIVSGRPITEIHTFLSPMKFPIAGQHGREIVFSDGEMIETEAPDISDEVSGIQEFVNRHRGLLCERKSGSVTLHYRIAPQLESECIAFMQHLAAKRPDLKLLMGKMVLELKKDGVDKGTAVRRFMESAPFTGRKPVFVGDDVTDEDGFRAAQELGGFGVKVGEGETMADYRLSDVAAVQAWLAKMAKETVSA